MLRAATAAVGAAGLVGAAGAATAQSDGVPVVDLTTSPPSTRGEVPTGADDVVFFVHGWTGGSTIESQSATLARALDQEGYDAPVVGVRYDASNPVFTAAQRDADDAGQRFADWLADYADANPATTIRAVAHSLGGRMIMSALAASDVDPLVDSVAPIGAAVVGTAVCPDGRYHDAIERTAGEVHNYHSRNDTTVCSGFAVQGGGLGCAGADCAETPENYADVDVTDQVSGHLAYTDPENGCVGEIVSNFRATDGNGGTPTDAPAPTDEPATPIGSDGDGDGLFEDVNGNGERDFGDVTALFDSMDDDAVASNPGAYDFNGNGELDFGDVVSLFARQ